MSLRSWLASKLQPAGGERDVGAPVNVVPSSAQFFGPGLANQPSHPLLLQESLGVIDSATRAIADRVASLVPEVVAQRRRSEGTVEDEILDDHPLQQLLDRPHPNITLRLLLRLTAQYLITVGESYWLKVGNGFGVPVELHPIPPAMVEPIVVGNTIARYDVTDADGRRIPYPAGSLIRFFFPDPESPWRSEGWFAPNAIAADVHKFISQHGRHHFQHDATPKTVLEAQEGAESFTPDQRKIMREQFRQLFHGRRGTDTGGPFVTPTGYKLVQLAMQSGAEVTPLLEYYEKLLLKGFRVPRSIMGEVVSGDRSSAETTEWIFDRHTILPIAELIADGLTLQLAPDFDTRLRVRFQDFVTEDKDFRLRQEAQDLEHAVRAINEVLRDRGVDTVPWGDKPIILGKLGTYDPNAPPPTDGEPMPPGAEDDEPDEGQGEGEPEEEEDEERLARDLHAKIRKLERAARRKRRNRAA